MDYQGEAMRWLQSDASHGGLVFPPKDGETSLVVDGVVHQFQVVVAMLLWMLTTCAKVVLALLPRGSLGPLPLFTAFLTRVSAPSWEDQITGSVFRIVRARNDVVSESSTIERALTQVLALVNDVPASSNKYLFLQDLADRLIEENSAEGGKYGAINRAVLRRGFARTIHLLGQFLECHGRRRPHSFLGTRFGALTIPEPFGRVWSLVGGALSPLRGISQWRDDANMAEKFARELLWITQKLLTCGGMEDAVQKWSSAAPLAENSLCASPNVQKSLVRLSALLCKSVMESTERTPHEVSANLLLSWLPLLCAATHGGDGPLFASQAERGDAEQQLERLVASLPEAQQERVLATWLHHYALAPAASHEWPNLVNCYHAWCYTTRKLE